MSDYQKKMDVEEAVRKLHVLKSGVALWQRDRDAIETLLAVYYEQKKEIAMLRAYKLDCDAAMKVGEWQHQNDDYYDWYECSECGYGSDGEMPYSEGETNYCPNCGAKMYSGDAKKLLAKKSCAFCRNYGSHNGVCDICENMNCWTERENTVVGG